MIRKNKEYEELESPILLSVNTKCPDKWILIDKENGTMYVGNKNGYWDRLEPVIKT